MNSAILNIVFSLAISFLITFYLVPFFCVIAQKLQFVDKPDGLIKKQKKAVPYFGGLAVYSGFIISLAFVCPADSQLFLLIIGVTILLFVGFLDDAVVMRPSQKLFGQLIAAFCFLKAGLYLKEEFFFNFWNIPISLLWILSIINAFNVIDVMDGLASIVALTVAISFFLLALFLNLHFLLPLLGSFIGAVGAFLWYNRPNARIYLGDAGSLFIGGFLSVVPFLFKWGVHTPYGYFTPIIVLAIPLLEIVGLIIIRAYKKIPIYKGSPDHFSLYLISAGWTKHAVLVYILFLAFLIYSVVFLFISNALPFSFVFIKGIFFVFIWIQTLCNIRVKKLRLYFWR